MGNRVAQKSPPARPSLMKQFRHVVLGQSYRRSVGLLFYFARVYCRNTVLDLFLVASSYTHSHLDSADTSTDILHNQHALERTLILAVLY